MSNTTKNMSYEVMTLIMTALRLVLTTFLRVVVFPWYVKTSCYTKIHYEITVEGRTLLLIFDFVMLWFSYMYLHPHKIISYSVHCWMIVVYYYKFSKTGLFEIKWIPPTVTFISRKKARHLYTTMKNPRKKKTTKTNN